MYSKSVVKTPSETDNEKLMFDIVIQIQITWDKISFCYNESQFVTLSNIRSKS